MAFMMPVVKNDYDIYKSARSRRSSECSNPTSCRSRKVSECKSEGPWSLSTSPGSDYNVSPAHRSSVPMSISRQFSRNSQSSLPSPCKSNSSSPPKSNSTNSLNKFHNRLVDRLKKSLKCKDSRDGELMVILEELPEKTKETAKPSRVESPSDTTTSYGKRFFYMVKKSYHLFIMKKDSSFLQLPEDPAIL